jgi:hypothetical protein
MQVPEQVGARTFAIETNSFGQKGGKTVSERVQRDSAKVGD